MGTFINPYRFATAGGGGPTFSNVKLLVHGGGANGSTTFTDLSASPHTLTATGNIQHTSGTTIGGENAILLDGAGDYLQLSGNPSDLFVGNATDFCIEAYIILDELAKLQCIFNNRQTSGGTGGYVLHVDSSNKLNLAVNSNSAAVLNTIGATSLTTGTLYHIAATRQGTTGRVFLNGNLDATATQVGTATDNAVSPPRIGSQSNFSRDFHGKMNWFRLTVGQALYTANFTPPTMPFPTS